MPKVHITKSFEFEAAHRLINYEGKCANLHGHTYKLQVTVSGKIYPSSEESTGHSSEYMVMDFSDLKKIVKEAVIDKYDHSYLNDFFQNPTAESMVLGIYSDINVALDRKTQGIALESVKLWETPDSYAEFKGEWW